MLRRLFTADFLAILGLVGALLTNEFLAASIILLMLLTGRTLERWAKKEALHHLNLLVSRMPKTTTLYSSNAHKIIKVDQIEIGDNLLVKKGEIIPVDGVLISDAVLDESSLTGEPLLKNRLAGDFIKSGVSNSGEPLIIKALAKCEDSTFAGIIKLVKGIEGSKANTIKIADCFAFYFTPFVLIFTSLTWFFTLDVKRVVAVLVAASPCPLILAVPVAIVSGLARNAKMGVIVKNGSVLESLSKVKAVVLDKTGTLTLGGPAITGISVKEGFTEEEILVYSASLEQYSSHILANVIVEETSRRKFDLHIATEVIESPGLEIKGLVEGREVTVGHISGEIPKWVKLTHPLLVGVQLDGVLIGVIGLDDPIRLESEFFVESLKRLDFKRILLVTGDRAQTAKQVGEALGIDEIYSKVSPEDKLGYVKLVQSEYKTLVLGDGINDAPALAQADVGVAMGGSGVNIASDNASVVIVDNNLKHLITALKIARIAIKKAIQASTVGISLSIFIMVMASLGRFEPTQAALLQEVIDVLAISWSLTTLKTKI